MGMIDAEGGGLGGRSDSNPDPTTPPKLFGPCGGGVLGGVGGAPGTPQHTSLKMIPSSR